MANKEKSFIIYSFVILSCIAFQFIDAKGFGSKGGGFKGSGKGSGTFGGSRSYSQPSGYGMNMNKGRSGSSFKHAGTSFLAGAAGGVAAYSIMRAMSGGSFSGYRPGYYDPGYGVGATCYNTEDFNGTVFGEFRCPLNGFPIEARQCCGERGKQFCCTPESSSYGRSFNGMSYFFWVIVIVILFIIIALVWVRYKKRQREDVILVPTEVPIMETKGPAFYQPPPPPMGYPPPPSQAGPYGPPPQYPMAGGNPYDQQAPYPPQQGPYPPQQGPYPPQQGPYPPQQGPYPPYNPYQGGPSY